MITIDFEQLFTTDPTLSKVPKKVFDWVIAREKEFPEIEYQIRFSERNLEKEKAEGIDLDRYEIIYGPSLLQLRNVIFPLSKHVWYVRLIGNIRDAIDASRLIPLLNSGDPRIEIIHSKNERDCPRGYVRINQITSSEEEMVNINFDRNINDEWEFRGTTQEFMDQKVKPLLN
ncbi:MAG: hypothetical protein WCI93_04165 [bacterium]